MTKELIAAGRLTQGTSPILINHPMVSVRVQYVSPQGKVYSSALTITQKQVEQSDPPLAKWVWKGTLSDLLRGYLNEEGQ